MVSLWKGAMSIVILSVLILYIKKLYNGSACESTARIDDQVVIVTGANSGIGKETAFQLAERGGKVYMACRSLDRCSSARKDILQRLNENAKLEVLQLDLASFKSIREFVKDFLSREKHLNVLVNNAGIFAYNQSKTEDGFELHFGVNHLGHFLLTNLLMDSLLAGVPSRIITLSSVMHKYVEMHWDDLNLDANYSSFLAYSQSKLANILFTRHLANHLTAHEIIANAVDPGYVFTDIMRHWPILSHDLVYFVLWPITKELYYGAQTTTCLAVNPAFEKIAGKLFVDCAESDPANAAKSDKDAQRLWDASVKMSGLQYDEIHPLLKP